MRIIIFAALPIELKAVIRAFDNARPLDRFPFRAFSSRYGNHEIIAAETGVGIRSAGSVFDLLSASVIPDIVVSVGFGGALGDEASIGDLTWGSKACLVSDRVIGETDIIDRQGLLSRLSSLLQIKEATVFTMATWMRKAEILRMVPGLTGAAVCDMETYRLAAMSVQKSLTFFSIRSISDRLATELLFPPMAVCDGRGFYSPSRAIRFFLPRPHLWGHVGRLALDSKTASRSITLAVASLLKAL